MSLSVDDFLALLDETAIVTRDEIQPLLTASAAGEQSAEALGQALVAHDLLTAYQLQQILAGKGKELSLGNYLVLDKLGQGGMGMVLKAEHRRMKRLVALKILAPAVTQTPAAVKRFQREVQAAAKLIHPNIVTAFDADEADSVHYLVMEYVAGRDLARQLALKGPLPVEQGLSYILQAAQGLAFAHENGIVHRDIKPANLLLDQKGTVKVLDLGLASMHGQALPNQEELTRSGEVMGTVDYMSPEQAFRTHQVDARTDIYSLGCTLYRLLTGRNMYEAESLVHKLMAHQTEPIPILDSPHGEIPAELAAIYTKMVAKKADDRYATMHDVIDDLQRVAAEYFPSTFANKNEPTLAFGRTTSVRRPASDSPTVALEAGQGESALTVRGEPAPTITFSHHDHGTDPVSTASIIAAREATAVAPKSQAGNVPKLWLVLAGLAGCLLAGYVAYAYFTAAPTDVRNVAEEELPPPTAEVDVPPMPPAAAISGPKLLLDPDYVWSEPIGLGPGVNTNGRELKASITDDERTILFTRELDLWMSERASIDEPFGVAVRLPDHINASHRGEMQGSLTGDGLWLAFTSNREGSQMEDIWLAQRSSRSEPFGEPVRLEAPVNSSRTERGVLFSPDGLLLLVTSDRNVHGGYSEIYQFTRASLSEPFGNLLLLPPHINSPAWNVPSWISADKCYLVKTLLKKNDSQLRMFIRVNVEALFGEALSLPSPFDRLQSSMPVFSADGQRAYFHTRDLPGSQDLDLWMVRRIPK